MTGEVAILGAGVMGGSIARTLSQHGRAIRIWTPDFGDAAQAGTLPGVTLAPDAATAMRDVDGVVFATPLGAVRGLLDDVMAGAPAGAWLQDVASLQSPPLREAVRAGLGDRYVSAHPMVGSHLSGFAGSRDDLYQGAPVWLSEAGVDPGIRAAAVRFWTTLGAEPDWIDADEHDERMLWVSHLPQLISVALAQTLDDGGRVVDDLGPGGREMTRLAASNPGMWRDLLAEAGPELGAALRIMVDRLTQTADRLENHDLDRIVADFRDAGRWRGE